MSKPGSRIQRLKEFTGLVDDSPRDYDRKEGKHRKTVTNKQYIFFYLVFTTDKQYVSSLQRFKKKRKVGLGGPH